jgi:hypothetical protein
VFSAPADGELDLFGELEEQAPAPAGEVKLRASFFGVDLGEV